MKVRNIAGDETILNFSESDDKKEVKPKTKKKQPTHLQAHLKTAPANANPKFLKELAKPAQAQNFKIFLHAKRKRIDKFNMKVQFDRNLRTDKNRQCITGGIFYCRDSGYFNVSASNKLSCNLTVKCFEIGNKNIPPIRYQQGKTKKQIINNI